MWTWLRSKLGGDPKRKLVEALGGQKPPSFEAIVMRGLELLRDPNVALSVVGEELEKDPGVSVRILRLANSSAFATRHPVRSVPHAAALLGRSELESLLLSVAVRGVTPPDGGGPVRTSELWRLAAHRAAVARALARRFEPTLRSEAFTAALLLDMAVPLVASAQGARYAAVLERWLAGDGALHELEREAFGWDHAGVAGALAEQWRFPEALAAAVACHHDAEEAAEGVPRAVAVCAVVERPDEEVEATVERLSARAAAAYGVEEDDVLPVVQAGWEDGHTVAAAFG